MFPPKSVFLLVLMKQKSYRPQRAFSVTLRRNAFHPNTTPQLDFGKMYNCVSAKRIHIDQVLLLGQETAN